MLFKMHIKMELSLMLPLPNIRKLRTAKLALLRKHRFKAIPMESSLIHNSKSLKIINQKLEKVNI